MKRYLFFVGWLLLSRIATAQVEPFKDINKKSVLIITQRVTILENAIQQSNPVLLSSYLAKRFVAAGQKFPNSVNTVLPAMLKRFPKAFLILTEVNADANQFDLRLNLSSFLKLRVKLDKDYRFKEINVDNSTGEDFREIEPALQAEKVTLPFHLIDGFIMIDGEVNKKRGRFMFDTGTPFSFILNSHCLGLQNPRLVVSGNAGSGQGLSLYYQDSLASLQITDQYKQKNLKRILFSDLGFIEATVGQDFLGFIGHEFFKNYEFSIDYKQQIITLFRLDQNGLLARSSAPQQMDTLVIFHFSAEIKQVPTVKFTIGQLKINGRFDTGNQGEIHLTRKTEKDFESSKLLENINKGYNFGDISDTTTNYELKGLSYNGNELIVPLSRMVLAEENELQLGYTFLTSYRSVWNFKKKTIALLKN